jgi:hypothetical protein
MAFPRLFSSHRQTNFLKRRDIGQDPFYFLSDNEVVGDLTEVVE